MGLSVSDVQQEAVAHVGTKKHQHVIAVADVLTQSNKLNIIHIIGRLILQSQPSSLSSKNHVNPVNILSTHIFQPSLREPMFF